MAVRNVRTIPDPILRMRAKPVKEINDRIVQLLDDLKETMDIEEGVGIAAPQVGILKQVFITFVDDDLIEMINPRIVEQRGSVLFLEGCLSIPDKMGYVRRPDYVKIEGLDRHGELQVIESTGAQAVVFAHEMDHLNGILFTDKEAVLTPEEKKRIEEQEKREQLKEKIAERKNRRKRRYGVKNVT